MPSADSSSLEREDNETTCSTGPGTADSDSSGKSRRSTICLDRALPPVPEQLASPIPPARPSSPHMPVSPSIYPPSRPESRASSTCSRPRSPSIAKLGHLSVVRQRLAQIEGCQQSHSAPNSPSSLYRNSSVLRTKSLRVETVFQAEVTSPASPTSIMNSYAGAMYPTAKNVASPSASPSVEIVQKEHVNRFHSRSEGIPASHQVPTISSAPCPLAHPILMDVHQIVTDVAQRTEETGNILDIIQNKMDQPTRSELDFATITQALGDIHKRLRSDLPGIMKSLAEIQPCRAGTETPTSGGMESSMKSPESCHLLDKVLPGQFFYAPH